MASLFPLILLLLTGAEPPPALPDPFTPVRFREHVGYLASDALGGREVGSKGSTKATDYIIRHLKECGATGLGPGGAWLQDFPNRTGVTLRPESSLAVVDGPTFTFGKDFMPLPLGPTGQWEADLVFAGRGVSAQPKSDGAPGAVDLKGKAVVILGNKLVELPLADPYWQNCERRGAAVVLVVFDQQPPSAEWSFFGQPVRRKIPCVVLTHAAAAKLFPKAEEWSKLLANPQPRSLGRKLQLHVRLDQKVIFGHNVLAVVPGRGELAREAVLVSAHHDHLGTDPALVKAGKDGIFNGADDNASGCAALLLMAQALHADRDRLPASRRTVLFESFDAEEQGLVGSQYYVSHPLWPLARTAADINFDMVGRLNRGKLMAMDSESNAFIVERVKALAPICGLRVETRLGGARRADNASFLDREIPAVHFSSGLHADYHRVSDEVDKIDAEGGARIAWLAYRLLRDTMDTPGRLRFQRPSPAFDIESILLLALRLGIIPEVNAQAGRHLLIRIVLPGSFAAKHGLQSGDEVVGINGNRFERLEDAALELGQLRLDQDLRFTVQRKTEMVEIKLPKEVFKDMAGPAIRKLDKNRFEVQFRYKAAAKVKAVTLVGTFNNWNVKAHPLEGPDKEGVFTTRLVLEPGVYEYKFVLGGKTYVVDPTNLRMVGPNGNSLLTVSD
jgi:hypothetical protein